jgi:ribonuclease HI
MAIVNINPPLPVSPCRVIATDGACIGNPGPGGWAFVYDNAGALTHASGSHPATTNNRMEATAIIMALTHLSPGERVCILSDSEITVKGLNEWRPGWKARGWKKSNGKPVANRDLWIKLDELVEAVGNSVSFHWVRGHDGHRLNEEADLYANLAATKVLGSTTGRVFPEAGQKTSTRTSEVLAVESNLPPIGLTHAPENNVADADTSRG